MNMSNALILYIRLNKFNKSNVFYIFHEETIIHIHFTKQKCDLYYLHIILFLLHVNVMHLS